MPRLLGSPASRDLTEARRCRSNIAHDPADPVCPHAPLCCVHVGRAASVKARLKSAGAFPETATGLPEGHKVETCSDGSYTAEDPLADLERLRFSVRFEANPRGGFAVGIGSRS